MTQAEAEARVWERWSGAAEHNADCEVRVAPNLTQAYEWGWVVFFSPVNREDHRYGDPLPRFAIVRRDGSSTPVGTKGLPAALLQLKIVTVADWRGRTPAEVKAMWDRVTTRT